MDWYWMGDETIAADIDRLMPFLERVHGRTPFRVEVAKDRLLEGTMQAFLCKDRSAIFGMMDREGTVWIYAAAGVMKDLLAGLDILEIWYYELGGTRIIIPGRIGWIRVLKSRGYSVVDDRLQKDLVQWVKTLQTMRLRIAS